jgi:hypothetical protein
LGEGGSEWFGMRSCVARGMGPFMEGLGMLFDKSCEK